MASEPFLNTCSGESICVVCGEPVVLRTEAKYTKLYDYKNDLTKLKSHAENWKDLDIPATDRLFCFTSASSRLSNLKNGYVHKNCVTNLRTKQKSYATKYKNVTHVPTEKPLHINTTDEDRSSNISPCMPCPRSSLSNPSDEYRCFVCNVDNGERTSHISTVTQVEKVLAALKHHLDHLQ